MRKRTVRFEKTLLNKHQACQTLRGMDDCVVGAAGADMLLFLDNGFQLPLGIANILGVHLEITVVITAKLKSDSNKNYHIKAIFSGSLRRKDRVRILAQWRPDPAIKSPARRSSPSRN